MTLTSMLTMCMLLLMLYMYIYEIFYPGEWDGLVET